MRNAVLTLAAAVALTAVAPPALAQAPAGADQADTRCLLVLQLVARDPKQAEQASKGMFFYLGRLTARGATARLEGLMKAEAAKLPPQQAQAELQRCGNELTARTREYQEVNKRLAASVKPATPPAKK